MRRILPTTLALLVATIACDRSGGSSTTPEGPPPAHDSSDPAEPAAATKPDACASPIECSELGVMTLLEGRPAEALSMLDYACSEGEALACRNLSSLLRGTELADEVAAHAAAKRGCELGNQDACVDFGVDQSLGLGGASVDMQSAFDHFSTACMADVGMGCRYVGVIAHEGNLGAKADDTFAMASFDRGCALGDATSCFNAGALIVQGLVPGELPDALEYLNHACEGGDSDGCVAAEQIAGSISEASAKVPGANLQVGSATVDGLTINDLECRIDGGGGGLLGNMVLIGALAKRKSQIDKCGKAGTEVAVAWTASSGKISDAVGQGKEGECVAKVLKKLDSPVNGECAAIIVLGTP